MTPTVAVGPNKEGGGGSDEETTTPQVLPPTERFLQKGENGLRMLGPLDSSALRVDLGVALHAYITQQWSMGIFHHVWGVLLILCSQG